jgi:hypothetical protein
MPTTGASRTYTPKDTPAAKPQGDTEACKRTSCYCKTAAAGHPAAAARDAAHVWPALIGRGREESKAHQGQAGSTEGPHGQAFCPAAATRAAATRAAAIHKAGSASCEAARSGAVLLCCGRPGMHSTGGHVHYIYFTFNSRVLQVQDRIKGPRTRATAHLSHVTLAHSGLSTSLKQRLPCSPKHAGHCSLPTCVPCAAGPLAR